MGLHAQRGNALGGVRRRRRERGSGAGGDSGGSGAAGSLPSYVPARFAPALRGAAQHWSVSATLLAAQVRKESGFEPGARSPAGALGISQFMPGHRPRVRAARPVRPRRRLAVCAAVMRSGRLLACRVGALG
ncbi:MAG: transglycosylase SLT domain-containing protein [Actinomycetota bacterium]|nr:transglycosylase SLT domain-containing protein [Actinomycetota bacterium]